MLIIHRRGNLANGIMGLLVVQNRKRV